MPILEVVELDVTKVPPDIYAGGTTAEVTVRNTIIIPWKYHLKIEYITEGKVVYTEEFMGWLSGGGEEVIHSETSWSADLVRAIVGTTRLLLLPETKEVDP